MLNGFFRQAFFSVLMAAMLLVSGGFQAPVYGATGALKVSSIEAPNIVHKVGTISDLRQMVGSPGRQAVQVLGYYAAGDGGGGPVRVWKTGAAGAYVDNGGSIIVPTGGDGSGAWVWEWSGPVSANWFGASSQATGSVNSGAFRAAFAAEKNVNADPGVYSHDGSAIEMGDDRRFWAYGVTLLLEAGSYSSNVKFITNRDSVNYSALDAFHVGCGVAGLTIDGNVINVSTTASSTGISWHQTSGAWVRDVTVKNMPGQTGGGQGVVYWYSHDGLVENCDISGTDRQNVSIWESSVTIRNSNLGGSYSRDCVLISSNTPTVYQGSWAVIDNVRMDNSGTTNGTHVARFSGQSSGVVKNCPSIKGNSTLNGIYIVDILEHNVWIENNTIDGCIYPWLVESAGTKTLRSKDNRFINCVNGPKWATSGEFVELIGDEIIDVTTLPFSFQFMDRVRMVGCRVSGGTGSGVINNTDHYEFVDNVITGNTNASYSVVLLGAPISLPVVRGNRLNGNTANGISISHNAFVTDNEATLGGAGIKFSKVGTAYMWRDSTGDLRISSTIPTTDTDGVVVGTQL